jgi:hypothetical protein
MRLVVIVAARLVVSIHDGGSAAIARWIRGENGRTGFGSSGDAGSVAVDASNLVYWNFSEAWPSADAPAYPYLISLDPGV